MRRLRFIDSHTGGEPTRVLLGGIERPAQGVERGGAELRQRSGWLLEAAIVEPRGSDILVGAVYWPPAPGQAAAEVVFFNNVGLLGMCGHGTIGLVASLAFLGELGAGELRLRTPVGPVRAQWLGDGRVGIDNVLAYREHKDVALEVPGYGRLVGDVAWGGNWFYLVEQPPLALELANREALTELAWAIRGQLQARGIRGRDGAEIDHVELCSTGVSSSGVDSRNFVLCPGKAYDRSPCGTGTSAKLACLAADGKLQPGSIWRQQGITGSVFEASYEPAGHDPHGRLCIRPSLVGQAQVTAVGELLIDDSERAAHSWR